MPYLDTTDEIRPGDPLGLASGRVPFILPKRVDVPISAALERAGKNSRLGENDVTWDWRM